MANDIKNKIKINMDSLVSKSGWHRHKVNDGSNVFRILPPFGENSNGYPYYRWTLIWGLVDPQSGRVKPFASSLLTEKRCPVKEFTEALKKRADLLKNEMVAMGESDEAIKERLSPILKLLSEISPKTVFVYNAVDKTGQVGVLELKPSAHDQMKKEMVSYIQDYNQDPTSLNSLPDDSGVWFEIIRTGVKWDTKYIVKRLQNKIRDPSGRLVFEDDRSPLPEAVAQSFETKAVDLSSMYQRRSYNELLDILLYNREAIVQVSPDVKDVFDSMFGSSYEQEERQPVLQKTQPKIQGKQNESLKKLNLMLQEDKVEVEDEEEVVLEQTQSFKKQKPQKTSSMSLEDIEAQLKNMGM